MKGKSGGLPSGGREHGAPPAQVEISLQSREAESRKLSGLTLHMLGKPLLTQFLLMVTSCRDDDQSISPFFERLETLDSAGQGVTVSEGRRRVEGGQLPKHL